MTDAQLLPHGRCQAGDRHLKFYDRRDNPLALTVLHLDPTHHGRLRESTFATVRLRQRVTKGPGSRAAGMAMAFKLLESAQARWRAVNAPHLVALVRACATFVNGKPVERPEESGSDQQVA